MIQHDMKLPGTFLTFKLLDDRLSDRRVEFHFELERHLTTTYSRENLLNLEEDLLN